MNSFNSCLREATGNFDNGDEINVQSIDFVDKKIVFVKYNGEIDTTFDVQAPDTKSLYDMIPGSTASEEISYEKICLIGDNSNIKLAVMVNHIAKLLYVSSETKGLIVSLSSKVFMSKQPNQQDFDRLLFVLGLMKQIIH